MLKNEFTGEQMYFPSEKCEWKNSSVPLNPKLVLKKRELFVDASSMKADQ